LMDGGIIILFFAYLIFDNIKKKGKIGD